MGGRALNDDEVREAYKKYMSDEGTSIRAIAERIPVSKQTLTSAFHRLGLPTKTRGKAPRELSSTDKRVHAFLVTYMTANDGVPPPVREISRSLGYNSTTSVISASLIFLRNQGLIRVVDGERNIRLVGGRYVYEGKRL